MIGELDPLLAELVRNAARSKDQRCAMREDESGRGGHVTRLLQPFSHPAEDICDRRLRSALAYIRDNIAEDISLDALASEAAMSRYNFARAFEKAVGRSPLQYVIRERMELR